jgi:histidine phosphotransferase ChpT
MLPGGHGMRDAPDLSALVSARLCHDLISPMGAIGNGLELLQLSAGPAAELALVNESLATALAKLRFYRIAFGPADPEARQSLDEVSQISDAMFHGRFNVGWPERGGDLPRTLTRVVYLAILCLEKSLPMGGRVHVTRAGAAVTLAVDAPRTAPPAVLWAHVVDGTPVPDLKPDGVQFALLRQALAGIAHVAEARFTATSAEVRLAAVGAMLAQARP